MRAKWWLRDESLAPLAESIAGTIRDIKHQALRSGIEIFKLTERKAVFRMEHPNSLGSSFVAKAILLSRFEHRFKYYKYGLNEAANLLTAMDRGINTPKIYGYGHIYGLFGLVEASVIIMEDLPGLSPIKKLLLKGTDNERHQIFMRTIPSFVSLYNAGCNHIDVNCEAIMLCEHGLNPNVFLLDFQYAKFHDKPSSEILMFEAGYFVKSCRNWISTETINEWLDELLNAVNIGHTNNIKELKERFYYYCKAELSRKHRKILI
jgi:tRNA A-37 threonylcarbamoyl transferase component Bud32